VVKKIIVYVAVCIILISASFFTGAITTKHRLVEQHRMELELSRQRAAALTDTITRTREEVGAIGESLSRQRTSTAELRELISEVRRRYEAMENLLNSAGYNDSDICSNDSCIDSSNGE
jgi:septal ring factor EnvC (AmiA/AmiB activator)